MDYLFSFFLGLVQGITEFLPVSSSGHLSLFQMLFGLDDNPLFKDVLFDVLLHLGTLVSVFIAFRKEIRDIWIDFLAFFEKREKGAPRKQRPGQRMIILILAATLPLLIVIPLQPVIEGMFIQPIFVGSMLMLTGVLLFFSDSLPRGSKTERNATLVDALIVGVMQAVAVCPGLSRSGTTIAAGLFCNFERSFAVRFSFLMSIPAVLGANLLSIFDAASQRFDVSLLPCYLLGMAAAGVSGYFAISLVKMIAQKGKFGGFALYCLIAGALAILYFIFIG